VNDIVSKDEKVVDIAQAKPLSKIEHKRLRDMEERIRRWINSHGDVLKGLDESEQRKKALLAIQVEDIEKMPLGEKFKHLERYTVMNNQAVKVKLNDLQKAAESNNGNYFAVAEALEVNFRAFAAMMVKLGIPMEEQKVFIDAAAKEREAEIQKAEEEAKAEAEAAKAKKEAEAKVAEENKANEILAEAERPKLVGVNEDPIPVPIPEGATVYEG
jgi:membrane protein involved in colicin uptake